MASTLSDDTAPSASLDRLEAQAAPTHPRASPEHLGSLPWPQEPASGRPKVEDSPLSTTRYRDPNQYPTGSSSGGPLKTHQTFVDGKQEAVLIPIHGRLVPFHISTVKNDQPVQNGLPPVSGRRPLGLPGLSRGSGRTFAPRSAA